MRQLSALALVLCGGCSAVFDLEAPVRRSDASVEGDSDARDAAFDGAIDAPFSCPSTYAALSSSSPSKYRVVTVGEPWAIAAADCSADGPTTHLVVLSTATEYTLVTQLVGNQNSWVGLNDIAFEGEYVWVTSEPAPALVWEGGQPSGGTLDNCVELTINSKLNDRKCDDLRDFVCECDAYRSGN